MSFVNAVCSLLFVGLEEKNSAAESEFAYSTWMYILAGSTERKTVLDSRQNQGSRCLTILECRFKISVILSQLQPQEFLLFL